MLANYTTFRFFCQKSVDSTSIYMLNLVCCWGISSAGRASALHAEGQEFDPPILHHN